MSMNTLSPLLPELACGSGERDRDWYQGNRAGVACGIGSFDGDSLLELKARHTDVLVGSCGNNDW